MKRDVAVDRIETILETIDAETMPVPVREVWVFGEVALGLDPIDRLDVYLTKDVLFGGEKREETNRDFEAEFGVKGIGGTVRTEWATSHPDRIETSDNGYVAPEKCLAAHLLSDDEPVHLEVCNASFDRNVTQRLEGALAREAYGEILDPRGVCLWVDGSRDEEAIDRLREGSFAMPPLEEALEMLGAESAVASEAATALRRDRSDAAGTSVRGDVV
ncbi:hypothetical protein ACERIT_01370 [Halopenitus sp. H-Gu1]|uniref:DUF7095 family protein n=1 Tax=Halopenitus sp. H-Gu1 TaxID=3242697 RepID=UPI00359CD284